MLPARWQSSRATSGVSFVLAGRVISCKVFATSLSGSTLRKGDCRRETLSAVFSVSSKIAIARAVGKIGENDGVLVGEFGLAVEVEVTAD